MWRNLFAKALSYLPSKKLTLIFLSLILSGGGVWFVRGQADGNSIMVKPQANGGQNITASIDTPIPRGSDADFKKSEIVGSAPLNADSLPLPTHSFVRDFAKLYTTTGGVLRQEDILNLTKTTQQNIEKLDAVARDRYTLTDIHTSSSVSVRNYLNGVGGILATRFPDDPSDPLYESELTVIQNAAAQKESPDVLAERLHTYIERYSGAAEDLQKILVPAEAKELHLALMNNFANTSLALSEISLLGSEPLTSISGFQTYAQESAFGRFIITRTKELALKHSITFAKEESGFELQKYFQKI